MFGLKALDVGIGMALMFLFVSLIASALREFGELLMKTRATALERGVREMLGEAGPADPNDMTKKFYDHPLVSALYVGTYEDAKPGKIEKFIPGFGRNDLPSYIPAENFSGAILQIARDEAGIAGSAKLEVSDLRAWIGRPPDSPLKKAIRSALDTADDNLPVAKAILEHWFDSTMDRVSGWYKRRTQVWLFVIGLGCAALMNIDAITVLKTLSTDDTLRAKVTAAAGTMIAACTNDPSKCQGAAADTAGSKSSQSNQLDKIKDATAQMGQVGWPIGWKDGRPDPQFRLHAAGDTSQSGCFWMWLPIVGGWLITAFGVTFGASFWFDVLNRFMVVRSTIKPAEKSPKEKSKS